MNQPVHIFKKDAVHLWPEILINLGLLGALVWVAPHTWGVQDPEVPWLYPLLSGFIKFLMPVAWLVLISRLVHDETLVGDRQFWITRPYTWYGLLGGKLLFLLAFIYLPLGIAQAWLMHHAGLYPTHTALPWLQNFAGITFAIILPLFALAAVTATFVRFALSVLAALVYLIAATAVAVLTIPNKLDVPYMNYVHTTLLVVIPLAALILQYARRKTALARTLLIALPALLLLIMVATPADMLIGRTYKDAIPVHASFDANPEFQEATAGRVFEFRNKVTMRLPIVASDLVAPASLRSEHQILKIDGPGDYHYETKWKTAFNQLIPGPRISPFSVELPSDVFHRVETAPVAMHFTLGVERFEPDTTYTVTATAKPFPILDHGACTVNSESGTLLCNFPFGNTGGVSVVGDAVAGNCQVGGPSMPAPGQLTPSPDIPALDPVSSQEVHFLRLAVGGPSGTAAVCPGAKLIFSRPKSTGKGSMQFDIPSVVLGSYAMHIPSRDTRSNPNAPRPAPGAQQPATPE